MKLKFNAEKILFLIVLLLLSTKAISQIDPGVDFDLNGYINSRLDAGQTTVVVPPGRYRVSDFSNTHLKFTNRNNVTIIADGVEMICTETVQAINIENCNNFKLKGITVDYDPLPFTQGEIVSMSADKSTLTVDLIDGYPNSLKSADDKIEIFDPVDGELVTQTYYGATSTLNASTRRVTVTKSGNSNHWEEVGDIVVFGSKNTKLIPHGIVMNESTNLVLEDVVLYAGTMFAFFETNCNASKYINCRVDRRPLETDIKVRGIRRMRSNHADGFHSKHAMVGPSYIGCYSGYNGDDGIAINGNFHVITETNGNVLTVVGRGGKTPNLTIGETVEIISYTGERVPNAVITQFAAGRALTTQEKTFLQNQTFYAESAETYTAPNVYYVTLDRPIDLAMGSLINSASRIGNGFVIKNCTLGHNRSRGMVVKAGDGIITGNTMEYSWGQAIMLTPQATWLEAGSGSNIVISNNVVKGCRQAGIAVYSKGMNSNISSAGAHDNIQITGNQVIESANPAIVVTSTTDLCLNNNTVQSPDNSIMLSHVKNSWGHNEDPNRTIYLENVIEGTCNDFGVTGVMVIPETASIVVTETYQLTANILPSGATNKSVTWSSSNPSIATVDSNGLVTAVAEGGPVTITATTSDGGFTDTSTITVNSVTVFPDEVISVSGPTVVNQGATIVIDIVYTASTTRDIVVNFQENNVDFNGDGGRFTAFGTTRATVSAGQGMLSVNVATSASAPISVGNTEYPNPYRHVAFMTTVGGNYSQRLDEGPPMTGISVTAPLSTSTFEKQMYSVYPNPSDDFIQVEIPNASFSKVQFRLYDLLGKLVFEEQVDPRKDIWEIGMSGLSKGIHILEITADDQVVHHKVIKK